MKRGTNKGDYSSTIHQNLPRQKKKKKKKALQAAQGLEKFYYMYFFSLPSNYTRELFFLD